MLMLPFVPVGGDPKLLGSLLTYVDILLFIAQPHQCICIPGKLLAVLEILE
jgi:hypothetical protein